MYKLYNAEVLLNFGLDDWIGRMDEGSEFIAVDESKLLMEEMLYIRSFHRDKWACALIVMKYKKLLRERRGASEAALAFLKNVADHILERCFLKRMPLPYVAVVESESGGAIYQPTRPVAPGAPKQASKERIARANLLQPIPRAPVWRGGEYEELVDMIGYFGAHGDEGPPAPRKSAVAFHGVEYRDVRIGVPCDRHMYGEGPDGRLKRGRRRKPGRERQGWRVDDGRRGDRDGARGGGPGSGRAPGLLAAAAAGLGLVLACSARGGA